MISSHLHGYAGNHVCRIPESNISTVSSCRWWIPRHNDQVQVYNNIEDDHDVPRTKFRPRCIDLLATVSNYVKSYRHQKEEERVGIYLKIRDYKVRQHYPFNAILQRGHLLKLNASPAGGANIIMMVIAHLIKYGPIGVPNGLVDAQNSGHGRTPCLHYVSVKCV